MIKSLTYLQHYISEDAHKNHSYFAMNYVDKNFDNAWTKMLDETEQKIKSAVMIEDIHLIDEWNLSELRRFMNLYFETDEYKKKLEIEADSFFEEVFQ